MKLKSLKQTWRWFGPDDPTTLQYIKQAGATGIVTSLYHIPNGKVWEVEAIKQTNEIIQSAGLTWDVVESLPVHEDIKRGSGNYAFYIEQYKQGLRNLATCGIKVVTYNFMPILDWTRTNLEYVMPDSSLALYFDKVALAVFDMYILKRDSASKDYSNEEIQEAEVRFANMSKTEQDQLTRNIIAGLPGGTHEKAHSVESFRSLLETYRTIDADSLRRNLIHFLAAIIPTAQECGIKMAIHPDDPPFCLLGLPRIVSVIDDLEAIFDGVPSLSNGLCFCTGSFGARSDNNLDEIITQYGDRIHFVHLRSTKLDNKGNFYEADHLDGDVDMYQVMKLLLREAGKQDCNIPFRPDHGHKMLDDLEKQTIPGYSAIGRLRGLAELRGLQLGILNANNEQ